MSDTAPDEESDDGENIDLSDDLDNEEEDVLVLVTVLVILLLAAAVIFL